MVVLGHGDGPAAFLRLDRDDLFCQPPLRASVGSLLLALERECVLLLARDAVAPGDVVRRLRHREAGNRVEKTAHERIFELALAEPEPCSGAADHEDSLMS